MSGVRFQKRCGKAELICGDRTPDSKPDGDAAWASDPLINQEGKRPFNQILALALLTPETFHFDSASITDSAVRRLNPGSELISSRSAARIFFMVLKCFSRVAFLWGPTPAIVSKADCRDFFVRRRR